MAMKITQCDRVGRAGGVPAGGSDTGLSPPPRSVTGYGTTQMGWAGDTTEKHARQCCIYASLKQLDTTVSEAVSVFKCFIFVLFDFTSIAISILDDMDRNADGQKSQGHRPLNAFRKKIHLTCRKITPIKLSLSIKVFFRSESLQCPSLSPWDHFDYFYSDEGYDYQSLKLVVITSDKISGEKGESSLLQSGCNGPLFFKLSSFRVSCLISSLSSFISAAFGSSSWATICCFACGANRLATFSTSSDPLFSLTNMTSFSLGNSLEGEAMESLPFISLSSIIFSNIFSKSLVRILIIGSSVSFWCCSWICNDGDAPQGGVSFVFFGISSMAIIISEIMSKVEQMKLLGPGVSPFEWRIIWALKLKGIEFEFIKEDVSNKSLLLLDEKNK
ncbi:hypothetical protein DH2020_002561 [Rehmannia glutinosa]|uniref:GST N-terminal domain-containing protein n=1 Tax=Rehmannia glutinosa TaxID=99300 RepID=A0ABR0XUI3_REHGL